MSVSSSCHTHEGEHVHYTPVPVQAMNNKNPYEFDRTKTLPIKVYLNDELVQLNTDQLLHIMELISARVFYTSPKIKNNTEPNGEDRIQFEYVLDVNHTFLHSIFGDTNATKINHILDHKLMLLFGIIFVSISAFMWFYLRFRLHHDSIVFTVYSITFLCFVFIPWLIFKHLRCNKVAFKLCIQTFDFWIKIAYGLLFSIAILFYISPPVNKIALIKIKDCLYLIAVVLGISYISLFDAIHSTKSLKLITSVVGALIFSFWSVYCQFLCKDEDDFKIKIQLTNGVNIISMQSLLANSSRIVAIFMWKQSYKCWKSKERAVTIVSSPKIIWIDANSTATQQNTTSDKINSFNNELDSFEQKVPQIDLQSDLHKQRVSKNANRHESISVSQ